MSYIRCGRACRAALALVALLLVVKVGICGAQSAPLAAMSLDLDKKITAPSAILMEASSGRVLWEKNADVARPIASVVKVMTLTLVMEALEAG